MSCSPDPINVRYNGIHFTEEISNPLSFLPFFFGFIYIVNCSHLLRHNKSGSTAPLVMALLKSAFILFSVIFAKKQLTVDSPTSQVCHPD
jgi:hypothetical protein